MNKKIIYYILLIAGILAILNSLMMARVSVGISHGIVLLGIIGICLIVFSILKIKGIIILKKLWIKRLFIICFCLAITFFLVIEGLIIGSYGYNSPKPDGAECVIVLGCGIFPDGTLTLSLKKRLDAAYDYLKDNPDTICIVSGGQGPNEPFTEAFGMSEYLINEKGIDSNRIFLEDKSTSTSENLLYSKEIMQDKNISGQIVVATSDFHMFRTNFLAKRYGMGKIIKLPSTTAWYLWANVHLREFLAVMKSFLVD